jgi:hypothetical protein
VWKPTGKRCPASIGGLLIGSEGSERGARRAVRSRALHDDRVIRLEATIRALLRMIGVLRAARACSPQDWWVGGGMVRPSLGSRTAAVAGASFQTYLPHTQSQTLPVPEPSTTLQTSGQP